MDRGKTKLPKGVSVRQYNESSGTLWVSFTFQRKQYRESLGITPTKPNIRFAEQLLSSVRLAIARGDFDHASFFPNSKQAAQSTRTLNEYVDERFAQLERAGAREQSTLSKRRELYRLHLAELGGTSPTTITTYDLEQVIRGSGLGKIRASQLISVIRPIFASLFVDESIRSNPCDHINWGDLYPRTIRRSNTVDPFSESEIRSILEHTTHTDIFTFALFTGVRLQELPLIKFSNIIGNTAQIVEAVGIGEGDTEYVKSTKTGVARTIDLLPPALSIVERQLKSAQLGSGNEFIFIDVNTSSRYKLNSIRWYWKRACRDAGIRYRPVKQTRHTFASLMLSRGENPMWVAKQLGHADLQMLKNHYARWLPEEGGYKPVNEWSI